MDKKLLTRQMKQAEFVRTVWHVTPDCEVEEMLKPEYWVHVAPQIKPGDRIEAIPADRHFFAEFMVLGSASNWVKVELMRKVVLIEDIETVEEDGFKVSWGGPAQRWRVTQGKEVLSKDHDTKELAMAWLKDHKKEIG
jgi:hypothetical protein